MKGPAPELIVIVAGLLLLVVGLPAWLGWERAAVILGLLLLVLGVWSAAGSRRGQG